MTLPIPFGDKFKSILVSLPVADIAGGFVVAALVTEISFTADAVVAKQLGQLRVRDIEHNHRSLLGCGDGGWWIVRWDHGKSKK